MDSLGMVAQQKDAEAVLATLWDVNDLSTSRIMSEACEALAARRAGGGAAGEAKEGLPPLLAEAPAAAARASPVRWPPAEPVKPLLVAASPGSSGRRWVASKSAMKRLQSNEDSEEPCQSSTATRCVRLVRMYM